ncbi:hypothetical protein VSAK1_00512 [Vibrio mediterranei AK1]|uniref:hypothetical protein n=1 Tax=Vibrio mediterranei TaxID=689 RepID=UPI000154142A|nr:hypothetical protein [Vibrio mediterranei]EDL53568.1 hypothetical protein VSAK1_00512 [Vibrio mediterranei AK1]
MNLTLQKKLAEIVMTASNAQSQVTAIKALDALGDEMDDSIFDPWISESGTFIGSTGEPEEVEVIFSPTPIQENKQKELQEMIKLPMSK